MILDHMDFEHDLLLFPWKRLRALLEDAWMGFVAREVRSRSSMTSLHSIDAYVSKWNNSKLTPHERSLQSALQSGSFIDAWTHSKYDVTKNKLCSCCGCPLDHPHFLVCPLFQDIRDQYSLSNVDLVASSPCLTLHLLCPRSPFLDELQGYFCSLSDTSAEFVSIPGYCECQHLFTDGSCLTDGRLETHRAAWGVHNSSTGTPVAAGWLPGLTQTIGRAELFALISALRWALHFSVTVHVWLDALEIHRGFQRRLAGLRTSDVVVNADLWLVVEMLLDSGAVRLATSSWVPSHLDPAKLESPFEEWLASGNPAADSLAVRWNQERGDYFARLLQQQRTWDEQHTQMMQKLRSFYFAVFDRTKDTRSREIVVTVESSEEEMMPLYSFFSVFSTDVESHHFVQTLGFPFSFLHAIISWMRSHEEVGGRLVSVSFLEITFGLLKVDPVLFPFRNPSDGTWQMMDRRSLFERPTLAHFYGIVQRVFRYLGRHWCSSNPILTDLNRSSLGVTIPLEGLAFQIQPQVCGLVQSFLAIFTKPRPLRKSCDFARPVA
eukprot:Skav213117  [mRNA]  locus=scaffold107:68285:69931:+ [translate_table: standard]